VKKGTRGPRWSKENVGKYMKRYENMRIHENTRVLNSTKEEKH